MTMHSARQQSSSNRPSTIPGIASSSRNNAASSSQTPPSSSRVLLMRRGGDGDGTTTTTLTAINQQQQPNSVFERSSTIHQQRRTGNSSRQRSYDVKPSSSSIRRRNIAVADDNKPKTINVNAEDEFPPLMSPASSALSSPHKQNNEFRDVQQQQANNNNMMAREAGRGIMNMLKRDGLLSKSVVEKGKTSAANREQAKMQQRNGPVISSTTSRYEENDDDDIPRKIVASRALNNINGTTAYSKSVYDNSVDAIDQSSSFLLNNNNNGSHDDDNNYFPISSRLGGGDADYFTQQHHHERLFHRKSSLDNNNTSKTSLYNNSDEKFAYSNDLEAVEQRAEKLEAAQARIKQQLNAKYELEKQQQQQRAAAEAASTASLKSIKAAANENLLPSSSGGGGGIIKLTKPLAAKIQTTTTRKLHATPAAPQSILHPLSDLTLKEKFLPKPVCLISQSMEWQESAQKMLLREYLDEHNENFTVIACIGPQSSGKSTILSCLGVQNMGNFQLFDHNSPHIVAPAQRHTSSINLYINAKNRAILLDSPGMLSSQILAELMSRPTRPPPLYNGDKANNVAGVHIYLEHQAEVYAYQMAAFLFAVSHIVLFCNDCSPNEYYQWAGNFLHKACILKPPALNVDTDNPFCGVLPEISHHERHGGATSSRQLSAARDKSSSLHRKLAEVSSFRNNNAAGKAITIADHWPNLYFVVNKARDAVKNDADGTVLENIDGSLNLCSVPDDRVRLTNALKSLISASPLGRAARFTDRVRINATTTGAGARADEEKWAKLAFEDCQLFVVPFIGSANSSESNSNTTATDAKISVETNSNNNANSNQEEEIYNPALRMILDDNFSSLSLLRENLATTGASPALSNSTNNNTTLTATSAFGNAVGERRAGILTGVNFKQQQQTNMPHVKSTLKYDANTILHSAGYYHNRRARSGLVVRSPNSHVFSYHQLKVGGAIEQSFYADLGNAEAFITNTNNNVTPTAAAAESTSASSGKITWKEVLANKQAYDTVARLRRTAFNAPSLPITPGKRMSEKQWLRYAAAMWTHIKSDNVILNYARAINMASSSAVSSSGT